MIQVNGVPQQGFAGKTIRDLLQAQGLNPERVAVEQNGEIIRRASFDSAQLCDGDKIEIVHFVGGG